MKGLLFLYFLERGNIMTRKTITIQKGFTLVELIVVIAIIAIIASISIIGFQSYIGRARLSNDVTDAKNMTNVLQAYMVRNNIDEIDPVEIRSVVNIDNEYTFEPRVAGYSFWYDTESNTIQIRSSYEAMSQKGDFTELIGGSKLNTMLLGSSSESLDSLANEPSTGSVLEEIVDGFYVLDVGGSPLVEALYKIRNLRTIQDYETITGVDGTLSELGLNTIRSHIETNYALEDTLFINDFFGVTAEGNEEVSKVVFADGIDMIPRTALSTVKTLPSQIRVPDGVIIEKGAFSNMTSETKILSHNTETLRVEKGAFRDDDPMNQDLVAKETTIDIAQLRVETNMTHITSRFYSNIVEGVQEYYGKTINTHIETPEMDESSFLKVFPLYESQYWTYPVMDAYDSSDPEHDGFYTITQEIYDSSSEFLGKSYEYFAEDIFWEDTFGDATTGSDAGYDTLQYGSNEYPIGVMGWNDGETISVKNWEVFEYRVEDDLENHIGYMRKHSFVEGTSNQRIYGYTFYDLTDTLIPVSNIDSSSFAGFSPETNTYGDQMVEIQMNNGNSFSYPLSLVYLYYFVSYGHISILGSPQEKTYDIYDQSHELIGSYTASNYKYDISLFNFQYGGCENMCFFNTYGGYIVSSISPEPVVNEASDSEGNPLTVNDFLESDSYSFIFDNHIKTVTFDSNVTIALKDDEDLVIYEMHVVYHEINSTVTCEVKGYDERGRLIAKGSTSYVQTYVETNILN